MFEDSEFAIDRQSESYKVMKPTEGARYKNPLPQESDDEPEQAEEPVVNKGRNLNSLFAGKADDSDEGPQNDANSDNDDTKVDNFEKKLSRDARKKQKQMNKKDKIIKNYG